MKLLKEILNVCKDETKSNTEIARIIKRMYGFSMSSDNIRKAVSFLRELSERDNISESDLLTLVGETRDKDGEIRTQRYADRQAHMEIPADAKIKGGSRSNIGINWVKWEAGGKVDYQEIINNLDFSKVPKLKIKKRKVSGVKMYNISDVHIGMSVESDMYELEWNVKELYKRLDVFISKFDEDKKIIINQLGDYTDGVNGFTSRGGHKLKQNMNDAEMFSTGLDAAVYMIDAAAKLGVPVVVNWLNNSNHPGVADENIGYSIKKIYKERAKNVTINLTNRYLHPVKFQGHDVILTHGYDKEYMKRGLPKVLKPEQENRVNNFIYTEKLKNVVLLRGDQHQFNDAKLEFFRDTMTPSFAPPSGWVQTNFITKNNGGFTVVEEVDGVLAVRLYEF